MGYKSIVVPILIMLGMVILPIVIAQPVIPPSIIIIDGISLMENRSMIMLVEWGYLKREVEVLPNMPRIEVAFNAMNIRSNIKIEVPNALKIIFEPSPIHGYKLKSLELNTDVIMFNNIMIKEVTTIANMIFTIDPPPSRVEHLVIGEEEVDFNVSLSTISLTKPVFVDPHGPLDIKFRWGEGEYRAKMMLYQDEIRIDGSVNGSINSFKVTVYPSIEIVEFTFIFSPTSSASYLLKELKKVTVLYEVTSVEDIELAGLRSTTTVMRPTTTDVTNTSAENLLQRVVGLVKDNLVLITTILSLSTLTMLFGYAISRLRLLLTSAFIIIVTLVIIMVIAYGG